jgi:hypothetical protein
MSLSSAELEGIEPVWSSNPHSMAEVTMGSETEAGTTRVIAFLMLMLTPLGVHAQQADTDRRSVRLAAGVVSQQGMFGDDHPLTSEPQTGATASLVIRRHPTHRLGLAFETALEPIAIRNPHFDESVSRLYLQIGAEIGRRFYVRPTVGGAINAWSGRFSAGGLTLAPAAALAAGYRHTLNGGWSVSPEFVTRATAEIGAITRSVGVHISVSRRGW